MVTNAKTLFNPKIILAYKKAAANAAALHIQKVAGVAGLEPTHAGFRIPCLTNLAIPLCRSFGNMGNYNGYSNACQGIF